MFGNEGFLSTQSLPRALQQPIRNIPRTNRIIPLETFQSHNEIKDSTQASNDHHSFTYWPLLAGYNGALSAPSAVQYIIYCSRFFMTEEILGRLPEGERYFSAGSLAQLPIFFHFLSFPQRKLEQVIQEKQMQ